MVRYLCIAVLVFSSYFHLQAIIDCPSVDLLVGATYRSAHFDWVLSGFNHKPERLATLIWKDLTIWQVTAEVDVLMPSHVYARFEADYGWITHGISKEIDVSQDGLSKRKLESPSKGHKGSIYDLSGGIGYQFSWCEDTIRASPLLGYAYNSQHLSMPTAHQSRFLNVFLAEIGALPQHRLYKARWFGPWLGVDLSYRVNCDWKLLATYEYHWTGYRAASDWTLRNDFPPHFSHHAHGRAQIIELGMDYAFRPEWFVCLMGSYEYWWTRIGSHIYETIDTTTLLPTKVYLPLRRVHWHSVNLSLSIGKIF